MARPQPAKTVVPEQPRVASIWTVLLLLLALLVTASLTAVFMVTHHTWTERVMSALPVPGPMASLAADPSLIAQMRLERPHAWIAHSADRIPVLVVEAEVANAALIEVVNVTLEALALGPDGRLLARRRALCGKPLSRRLLGRLRVEEIAAATSARPARPLALEPGHRTRCQVAFAGLEPGVSEVSLRIASVEPLPGHSRPLFLPGE